MTCTQPIRRPPPRHGRPRHSPIVVAVLVVLAAVLAAAAGLLGYRSWEAPLSPTARDAGVRTAPAAEPPRGKGALGPAAGAVPDGATVFDDDLPAVTELDPALLGALRRAASDARGDGVTFVVNSGWRSPEYQEQLLREAVEQYGSVAAAARWVATADTSSHVSGDAIDIGHTDAATWLADHGAGYGLCRVYRNEPWHFELRPDAVDQGCPRMYADPTHDPRMQ